MAKVKVTELGDRPQRDRRDCATCRVPPGHERHDDVWARAITAPIGYRVRVQ